MPFINGNFYMNPAYGQALERGFAENPADTHGDYNAADEASNSGNEAQPEPADPQAPAQQPPAPPQQRQPAANAQLGVDELTNIIHNEAGGVRPTSDQGPGSARDLADARAAMAPVVVNRQAAHMRGGLAPPTLAPGEQAAVARNPIARAQYQDARNAAEAAVRAGGNPQGPRHFFLAEEGLAANSRPAWARGTPVQRFGPFINTAGGGDVQRGARFYIEIHP